MKKLGIVLVIGMCLWGVNYLFSYDNDFCFTDSGCIALHCGNVCGNLCINHKCTQVSCEDHGKLEKGKCICHEGYTGRYCEKKIKN